MSNTFEIYLGNFIFILAIMKLFRMDLISKYISLISILIFSLIAYILMVVSVTFFPFLFFGLQNETLQLVLYIITPVVLIALYFIYKDDTHAFIYNLKKELKNDIYSRDRTIFSSIATNSPLEALNNFLYIIKDQIESKFTYNLCFFIFYYIILIDIYYFEHIPLFGFLEDYGIFFISKLHLIWLIPTSFAFTYIYSKYYYDFISARTYEKLITISKFMQHEGKYVCLSEYKELITPKIDSIVNSYKFSKTVSMVEMDNEIYYLLKNKDDYQTFKASYILINDVRNKFIFTLKYYKDNFQ